MSVPSPPPLAPAKAFSRSGCGQIFPLFSRVMRVELTVRVSGALSEFVATNFGEGGA